MHALVVYHVMYDGVVVIGGRSCVVDAGGYSWFVGVGGRSCVGWSVKNSWLHGLQPQIDTSHVKW